MISYARILHILPSIHSDTTGTPTLGNSEEETASSLSMLVTYVTEVQSSRLEVVDPVAFTSSSKLDIRVVDPTLVEQRRSSASLNSRRKTCLHIRSDTTFTSTVTGQPFWVRASATC